MKLFFCLLFFMMAFFSLQPVQAATNNSFVSIVSPIRGDDFWTLNNQKPIDGVLGQLTILRQNNLAATFLIRYDALKKLEITSNLKPTVDEKGLFLEVTPTLTTDAAVNYHQSVSWHNAASVLLTGYGVEDRYKLIDTSFNEFKKTFGYYPKSVGAWWIDAASLQYMQKKYGLTSTMIVADQYSTDSYQIWGQYWGTPYYPAKNNALFPAQSMDNKIPVVITQWAARDPVNGYGTGVEESTYSVQANDYIDYHNLDTNYFSKLVDDFTKPETTQNQLGQIVVGLENSYQWTKYQAEYQNQIKSLIQKQNAGQFRVVTLEVFAKWYQQNFPNLSPDQLIVAKDPLGSSKQAVWYMNGFYRVGWINNNEGSVIRDLRQYVSGQNEICLEKICNEVNFATFATRVLDEVTYGQKRVVDSGRLSNLQINRQPEKTVLRYNNEAGLSKTIEFLARDISIGGKPSSIDGFILDTIQQSQNVRKQSTFNGEIVLKSSFLKQIGELVIFVVFLLVAVFIPGWVAVKKILVEKQPPSLIFFLATTTGLIMLTLVGFFSQLIFKSYLLTPIWVLINMGLLFYFQLYRFNFKLNLTKKDLILPVIIILGTIFLTVPTFRSGLEYGYGVGFWGPNSHDGVWHLALISELEKVVPPENPILAGKQLENYHYFFDLLVAQTAVWSKIPAVDLLFREFPILFGLLLGLATLSLLNFLVDKKSLLLSILGLYFVYTTGSFGWIVELIKNQGWNGESDFWANQAISFNLNPPFMLSLLVIIAFCEILFIYLKQKRKLLLILLVLLSGSLLELKAYAAILLGVSLLLVVIAQSFKRQTTLIPIIFGMGVLSLILILPNYPSWMGLFQIGVGIFEFLPLWFVHSMIDAPDRLGISRLTLTRITGYETHNIVKIVGVELVGIFLFIVGNLGVRSIGLILLFQKKSWLNFPLGFILLLSLVALFIPLLFIQKGTAWNTIQFFYFALFFSSLFAAITLEKISTKLPQLIALVIVGLAVILGPINCLAVAQGYLYSKPHTFISSQEMEALQFLKSQTSGVVLTPPFNSHLKKSLDAPLPLFASQPSAYVSAFSEKPTFVEDEDQQQILNFSPQPEYTRRLIAAKDFFAGMDSLQARSFLRSSRIKYIHLPKIYGISLDRQDLGLKNIFENDQVIIYIVRN